MAVTVPRMRRRPSPVLPSRRPRSKLAVGTSDSRALCLFAVSFLSGMRGTPHSVQFLGLGSLTPLGRRAWSQRRHSSPLCSIASSSMYVAPHFALRLGACCLSPQCVSHLTIGVFASCSGCCHPDAADGSSSRPCRCRVAVLRYGPDNSVRCEPNSARGDTPHPKPT